MEHKEDFDTSYSWYTWGGAQKFGKGTGSIENLDHPNQSIIKIGKNAEKSLGNLRGIAVTQTLVKDYQLMLAKKICKK